MDVFRVLIIQTHVDGGANLLLDRVFHWLIRKGYYSERRVISENTVPKSKEFDLAILPCYAMDDVYYLHKKKTRISRVLLWDMGMGCFQDGYYNPYNTTGIKGRLTNILKKEAEKALRDVTEKRAICFTDVVGRVNTYKTDIYSNENYKSEDLINIGVDIPDFSQKKGDGDVVHVCWVGRVSKDFKYIPLLRSMTDLDEYVVRKGICVEYTVVGEGDALDMLKKDVESLHYSVSFVGNINYNQLPQFFQGQDLAFVMGTSALDAARNSCAAVVVTPVRYELDEPNCYYRWIYESKGYSLGEYPGWDDKTHQVKKTFSTIMNEYFIDNQINKKCYDYTLNYSEDKAFERIFQRGLPERIDKKMMRRIKIYYYLKFMMHIYEKKKEYC